MKQIIHKLGSKSFFSKKKKDGVTRSHPSSFSSTSSSDSSSSNHRRKPSSGPDVTSTPTSVLPERSGDWSDISADIHCELVEAFKLLDRDNDGLVSRTELESLLIRLGTEPPTQEEVSLMLSEVGSDGVGCISLDSLMSRVVGSAYEPSLETELRETFDFFDTDHDGKITAEELLRVFTVLGDKWCTLDDCRHMIALVSKNDNGFVCFEDFSKMMQLQRLS